MNLKLISAIVPIVTMKSIFSLTQKPKDPSADLTMLLRIPIGQFRNRFIFFIFDNFMSQPDTTVKIFWNWKSENYDYYYDELLNTHNLGDYATPTDQSYPIRIGLKTGSHVNNFGFKFSWNYTGKRILSFVLHRLCSILHFLFYLPSLRLTLPILI